MGLFATFKRPNDSVPNDAALRVAYALYHWGTDYPERTLFGEKTERGGEKLFDHAEEFIVWLGVVPSDILRVYVEEAIAHRSELTGFINSLDLFLPWNRQRGPRAEIHRNEKLQECLLNAARRLLAFECCAFLRELENTEALEPFTPYRAWAKHLSNEDALISFNYDLVVETIARMEKRVLPVCKLHGSIGEGTNRSAGEMLMAPDHVPKILIPGREKNELGEHQAKWDEAARDLESAERVVFLGYGLPESDANAREFLLKHLRRNDTKHLTIEIVLGEPNFRTQRLEATLRQALGHRSPASGAVRPSVKDLGKYVDRIRQLEHEAQSTTGSDDLKAYLQIRLEEERRALRMVMSNRLELRVLPQYAQDYMQAFATDHGSRIKPNTSESEPTT